MKGIFLGLSLAISLTSFANTLDGKWEIDKLNCGDGSEIDQQTYEYIEADLKAFNYELEFKGSRITRTIDDSCSKTSDVFDLATSEVILTEFGVSGKLLQKEQALIDVTKSGCMKQREEIGEIVLLESDEKLEIIDKDLDGLRRVCPSYDTTIVLKRKVGFLKSIAKVLGL